jgi:hypothetical protein
MKQYSVRADNKLKVKQRQKKVRSRKQRLMIVGVSLLLIFLAVHWLNAPSRGRIIPADNAKLVKSTPKITLAPASTISNKYFSLPLPAGYAQQANVATPTGLLYAETIINSGAYGSLIIAVSLETMPDGGLTNDSSYQLRASQPANYSLTTEQVDGETIHIANSSQTAAVVAFWPHSNYIAVLSVSSGDDSPPSDNNSDELRALAPLLSAWQWL